jgi:hypothetical protein
MLFLKGDVWCLQTFFRHMPVLLEPLAGISIQLNIQVVHMPKAGQSFWVWGFGGFRQISVHVMIAQPFPLKAVREQ